ncbi:coiled coil domain-containing protein [Shewanella algidipiscicola]|uniref:coiled coil domain-containing protein n=1 Tax=Shewanella algidipiscicola TaxID=614070 RepID=UPI000D787B77|nr:coiled coil domain-containing protein [Shewanella algidipiscicola]
MSMKQAYEKKLRAQLNEWSADIDKLKAKVDKAEAEVQIEYYKKIDELRTMQRDVAHQLTELRESSDDAWEDIKAGINSAWDSLDGALKSAAQRFK